MMKILGKIERKAGFIVAKRVFAIRIPKQLERSMVRHYGKLPTNFVIELVEENAELQLRVTPIWGEVGSDAKAT